MIKLDFKNDLFSKQLATKIGVIFIVVVVAIIAVIILSGQIKEKTISISGLQAQSQTLASQGEAFSRLMKDYQVASPYLESVKQLLPNQNQIISFSKDMADAASSFNVNLGFGFEKEGVKEVSEGVGAISFSMSLSGNFSNIVEFITSLKESRYFVDFNSFDFTGGSADSIIKGDRSISAIIRGRVFIRNQ